MSTKTYYVVYDKAEQQYLCKDGSYEDENNFNEEECAFTNTVEIFDAIKNSELSSNELSYFEIKKIRTTIEVLEVYEFEYSLSLSPKKEKK